MVSGTRAWLVVAGLWGISSIFAASSGHAQGPKVHTPALKQPDSCDSVANSSPTRAPLASPISGHQAEARPLSWIQYPAAAESEDSALARPGPGDTHERVVTIQTPLQRLTARMDFEWLIAFDLESRWPSYESLMAPSVARLRVLQTRLRSKHESGGDLPHRARGHQLTPRYTSSMIAQALEPGGLSHAHIWVVPPAVVTPSPSPPADPTRQSAAAQPDHEARESRELSSNPEDLDALALIRPDPALARPMPNAGPDSDPDSASPAPAIVPLVQDPPAGTAPPMHRVRDLYSGEPMHVLFLGNSYTFMHDLPGMIEKLARASGHELVTDSYTKAGTTVKRLAADPRVQAHLEQESWDYVVIQGKSIEPITDYDRFYEGAIELAQRVVQLGATPVFFETWARRADSPFYDRRAAGDNQAPAQMQSLLHDAYGAVAVDTGALVVPVGQVWASSLRVQPKLKLHASDSSHPNVAGSYLSACVFFAVLGGVPSSGNSFVPAALKLEKAQHLQSAADAHAFPWRAEASWHAPQDQEPASSER